MTQRLTGAVTSALAMLAGLWLILAPFALGTQPNNIDWKQETFTNVWSGIGLGTLGLIGVITFITGLIQHLGHRGLITRRSQNRPSSTRAQPEPAPTTDPATPSSSTELDKLIAPLVASLATDLTRDRETEPAINNSDHLQQSTATSQET